MLRAALTRCWSGGGSVGSWTGLPPRRFDSNRRELTWARHTRNMVSCVGWLMETTSVQNLDRANAYK